MAYICPLHLCTTKCQRMYLTVETQGKVTLHCRPYIFFPLLFNKHFPQRLMTNCTYHIYSFTQLTVSWDKSSGRHCWPWHCGLFSANLQTMSVEEVKMGVKRLLVPNLFLWLVDKMLHQRLVVCVEYGKELPQCPNLHDFSLPLSKLVSLSKLTKTHTWDDVLKLHRMQQF